MPIITKTTSIALAGDEIAGLIAKDITVVIENVTTAHITRGKFTYIRIKQGSDLIAMNPERAIKVRDALTAHLTELGL